MTASTTAVQNRAPEQDTRFDRRFSEILDYAAEVFAEKGYEGASMRDLSRLSGMSLAGLYYYFDSKESCCTTFRSIPSPPSSTGCATASQETATPKSAFASSFTITWITRSPTTRQ
jgi:hypothetical protein